MDKSIKILLVDDVIHSPVWDHSNYILRRVPRVDSIDTHMKNEQQNCGGVNNNEEINDPSMCSQPAEQVSRQVWPHNHTWALIEAVDAHYEDMNDVKKRKHFWKVISQILESNQLQYSEDACKKKWANLLRTYRVVKESKNKSGRATTRFPFFQKMDDIFGNLPTNKSPQFIDVNATDSGEINDGEEINDVCSQPAEQVSTDSGEVNDSEEINDPSVCSQSAEQVSRQVWPHNHTLTLIEAVDAQYEDMNDVRKRSHFWKVISQILESNQLQYSEDACKKKWSNLLRTYRVVKESKNKRGKATSRFPFFEKIDDIVGDLPTIKSPHFIDVNATDSGEVYDGEEINDTSVCSQPAEQESVDSGEVNDSDEINDPSLCNQPDEQVSRQVWPHNHTLALIEAVDAHYEDMHDVRKMRHFWKVISQILESNELQYSKDACKKKWANLLRTYRVVKDSKNKSGRATTRFPFFEKIDDIVGDLPTNKSAYSIDVWKTPGSEVETSTSTVTTLATSLTVKEEDQEGKDKNRKRINPTLATSLTVKEENQERRDKNRKRKNPTTEYLKFKKRYYENKEKRSKEKSEERKRVLDEMLALQKQKLELLKDKNKIEERKVRALEALCTINNN